MFKRLLMITLLLPVTVYGADVTTGYADPEFSGSVFGLQTTIPGTILIEPDHILIFDEQIKRRSYGMPRIQTDCDFPLDLIKDVSIEEEEGQRKTYRDQLLAEIFHILVSIPQAFEYKNLPLQTARFLIKMFWNRIHLLELWHEKLKEALDNALKEEYNDAAPRILTRLQSRHDKLVAFRTQYSSDLYPFQTTRNTTGLLQYKFSEYPDLRNLRFYQAFLNVFCPGDDIVLLPDIVPLVEINDSSTNIPEDPDVSMLSADLFEERMTDDGLMKFTILTRLTSETVQTWLSEIRLHPLGHSITTEDKLKEIKLSRLHIVKDECDFILNALVPKEQNEKVRSVLKELFWNRVYLLKILLENALTYAPLNEEIKKELHIRYSRLVCFMMHVDQNSLEYFTPSLYEGEHRIYDTYFEGHGKFNPHEKLNFLFQDIWY